MTVIKQDDLIRSVADALQFISYYHPVDFIQAMHEAYLREESAAARDSIAQILINSRMCATGHRPICRDTASSPSSPKVGMDVRWDGATLSLDEMINEGVRRAYNLPENVLRASILADRPVPARTPRDKHTGGDPLPDRSRQHRGNRRRGQGRRLREQVEDGHAQPVDSSSTGCSRRADMAPAGARRACWASASAGTAEKAAVLAKESRWTRSTSMSEARGPQIAWKSCAWRSST